MKLYVGNLAYATTEAELRELFGRFGSIVSVKIVVDRETNRPRGFAFVEMASAAEGDQAIKELNGKEFQNRALVVNEARPQTASTRGGGFRR